MYDTITSPFCTAIPKTAMKPTIAGTLNGNPEISRKVVLPTSAMGMLKMIVSVLRSELKQA